jgi:hypothetical protein
MDNLIRLRLVVVIFQSEPLIIDRTVQINSIIKSFKTMSTIHFITITTFHLIPLLGVKKYINARSIYKYSTHMGRVLIKKYIWEELS